MSDTAPESDVVPFAPVVPSNPTTITDEEKRATVEKLATSILPDVMALVEKALQQQGADKQKDAKAYYLASRLAFRAVMAAASQRMFEDGANRNLVSGTVRVNDGWELFLSAHPDIKAKVEAEQQAKQEAMQKLLALAPAWKESDEDFGDEESDEDEEDSD